jgi:transcriptional regulator with XRE-family HTH domain
MSGRPSHFASWLSTTMQRRGLSQAELARVVGVADTQVSRWRRGQVVPTVHYLQRMADALDVSRATLDELAGYPVEDSSRPAGGEDSERLAELQALQVGIGRVLAERVPRRLWGTYAAACEALADELSESFQRASTRARGKAPAMGFPKLDG